MTAGPETTIPRDGVRQLYRTGGVLWVISPVPMGCPFIPLIRKPGVHGVMGRFDFLTMVWDKFAADLESIKAESGRLASLQEMWARTQSCTENISGQGSLTTSLAGTALAGRRVGQAARRCAGSPQ